jgi:arylsulfatase A-like enzyme
MRAYTNIPSQGQVSDSIAIDLIHGYYATISYTDALVGKILNALKEEGLEKNTIVLLVSDHGYNLQEHTQWAKFTNYNTSTQVPLILYNPLSKTKGTTNALTSLVDVYPTLVELCELDAPKKQLDGVSLVPVLNDPNSEGKKYIFIKKNNGFTLITKRFSYTEFIKSQDNSTVARMLYDHRSTKSENINVAHHQEFESVIAELSSTLHSAFQKNITGESKKE